MVTSKWSELTITDIRGQGYMAKFFIFQFFWKLNPLFWTIFWNCYFPMSPHFHLSVGCWVGRSVGRSVGHNFLKRLILSLDLDPLILSYNLPIINWTQRDPFRLHTAQRWSEMCFYLILNLLVPYKWICHPCWHILHVLCLMNPLKVGNPIQECWS